MLCQACTRIFEHDLEFREVQPHCIAQELRQASESGCELCRLLWTSFYDCIAGDVSQDAIAFSRFIERGRDSRILGYTEGIPADLYILTFFLKVESTVTIEEGIRYCSFILEPYEG